MALDRTKKNEIVSEMTKSLSDSKMTVVALYKGTPVKAMQELRRKAKEQQTTIKVVKNRLIIKALQGSDKFKDIDTSVLNGMLLYAFNDVDETAPAQVIAQFAKTQPNLEIIGAFSNQGELISAADANAIASLPSKEQLRGQLVGVFAAPLSGFMNVLLGNVQGVLNVLNARSDQLS